MVNKFNENSQIESNNSIVISGIKTDNNKNYNNAMPIIQMKNNNVKDTNIINEKENNNSKEIRKKILCMHEFSKTGYAGDDEK